MFVFLLLGYFHQYCGALKRHCNNTRISFADLRVFASVATMAAGPDTA
ncbi:hypothetical protein [Emticicia sp. 17c]